MMSTKDAANVISWWKFGLLARNMKNTKELITQTPSPPQQIFLVRSLLTKKAGF